MYISFGQKIPILSTQFITSHCIHIHFIFKPIPFRLRVQQFFFLLIHWLNIVLVIYFFIASELLLYTFLYLCLLNFVTLILLMIMKYETKDHIKVF